MYITICSKKANGIENQNPTVQYMHMYDVQSFYFTFSHLPQIQNV